jgi:hypothetical protein
MSIAGIQDLLSTNCIEEVVLSKWFSICRVNRKLSRLITKAADLIAVSLDLLNNVNPIPAMIGKNIITLNIGKPPIL